MKILTAKQFLKEPYGTLYVKYDPECFIGGLTIKSEERGELYRY